MTRIRKTSSPRYTGAWHARLTLKRGGYVLLAALLLSGGGSGVAASPHYAVLYRFHGGADGYQPIAALSAGPGGVLFGVTAAGGTRGACDGQAVQGCGTVFELTPPRPGGAWSETVLYRFQGGSDGAVPRAPLLVDAAGNLYGTTAQGGGATCTGGCGTVFELVRPAPSGGAWSERVLYRFVGVPSGQGDGDAATPNGLVFDHAGNLYGMAINGGHCVTNETGTYCYGAIFALLAPAHPGAQWTEQVLYRFDGPSGSPSGPLFDAAGNLYGVAIWGQSGYGMVFQLAPPARPGAARPGAAWTETAIHSFNGRDGAFPASGLTIDGSGRLYGATLGSPAFNDGTVYRLAPPARPGGAWSIADLYTFTAANATSGTGPNGDLVLNQAGALYGTTQGGGRYGYGTAFALVPPATPGQAWTESVMHSFAAGSDGVQPLAGLAAGASGALYGVTSGGGGAATQCGLTGATTSCGTVFALVP